MRKKIIGAALVLAVIAGSVTSALVLRGEPDSASDSRSIPASASGVVLRNLDFDTCNDSQWSAHQQWDASRSSYQSGGAPVPRQGASRCFARLEVHDGEEVATGERNEHVLNTDATGAHNGVSQWYGWSTYVPTSNPDLAQTYNIFAQWHAPRGGTQPNLSLDLDGTVRIYGGCPESNGRCETGSGNLDVHPRGRWVDWVVFVRWSDGSNGQVTVFRDGVQVFDDRGPNLYLGVGVYFKYGLYRGKPQNGVSVIYQDAAKVGTGPAAVDPGGSSPSPRPPTPPPPKPPEPSPQPSPAPGTVTVLQTLTSGTLSGTVTWLATVTGCTPKPTKVEFFVGDTLVLTEINAPFGDTVGFWNSASVPNGRYSVRARATCPSGVFTSPTAVVTVAN